MLCLPYAPYYFLGLLKFLGKGTTGKIVEDSEEKLRNLLKTFRANLQGSNCIKISKNEKRSLLAKRAK